MWPHDARAVSDGVRCLCGQVYNVAQHPKVLTGEFSEEMALTDVLSKYGDEHFRSNGDGKLSLAEFEQYYANVGANIDTDEYFELMMRQAWQI